jgi:aryl-alcohol dehydrogenase-like predicted oxidoreductase
METRELGITGLVVSEIGLGCMGVDHAYGPAACVCISATGLRRYFDMLLTTRRATLSILEKGYR